MWKLKLYRDKWCAVTRINGKTKRVSLRTGDPEEARRRFTDFIKASETPADTAGEIMDVWIKEQTHKPSYDTSRYAIKALKPHFGHLRPDQITRSVCRDYCAFQTQKGKKPATIRRELDVLRSALYWHDRHSPAQIEKPPAPPPKTRYLTREEYDRLLSAAVSPHIKLFIILALSTAARASALLDLTWGQVDFDSGLIVLSKGGETLKRRATVPMTQKARGALEEAYKARTTDYVIEYGGEKVAKIIKGFKRTARKAGLFDVTPHVLRHTAAVWMAEAGIPMSEISQFLGHTNTSVTERVYARYSPDYLRNAASALEV